MPTESTGQRGSRARTGMLEAEYEAIRYLLEGKTAAEVARILRKNRVTVWQWTQRPEFVAELERQRKERTVAAVSRLGHGVNRALDALIAVVQDADPKVAHARVKAAEAILDRSGLSAAELAARMRPAAPTLEELSAMAAAVGMRLVPLVQAPQGETRDAILRELHGVPKELLEEALRTAASEQ